MTGPIPPALRRAQSKDKGIPGRKGERAAADRLGALLRPGSGALDGAKGDYEVGNFLVENKTSSKDARTFTMTQAHFHKIYQEALERSKQPALAFQFVNSQGQSEKRDRWVAIPEAVWRQLLGG